MDDILKNKGTIRNPKDGSTIVPLENKSYGLGLDKSPIEGFFTVTKGMAMRSDLFAITYATSPKDEWTILKYNNISNPFIIKEGDVLAIPDFFAIKDLTYTVKKREEESPNFQSNKEKIRDQFKKLIDFSDREDTNTNTFANFKQKYAALEEAKRKAAIDALRDEAGGSGSGAGSGDPTPTEDLLPPTFSDGDASEFTVLPNGDVLLGTSTAPTDESCAKKTTTKAELINALIKNRVVR